MTYQALRDRFARLGQLREIEAIVEWDRAVNMPDPAAAGRADAVAGLSVVLHDLLIEPALGDWLAAAEQEELSPWESANLEEMRRQYRRAVAVPADLVERQTRVCVASEQAWRSARQSNNFKEYCPVLEEVVKLRRETAVCLGEALGLSPYDALIDEYEPGAKAEEIDALFRPLEAFLPEFTQRVLDYQAARGQADKPRGPFAVADQRQLGVKLMEALGFQLDRGRLDVSHHPFCGGVSQDVRITTRYAQEDFTSALMGVLHEAGHGKYEQGLPQEWRHQPVGLARGMLLHESQSLLQEMQVCRSPEFMTFAAPLIRQAFPEQVRSDASAFELDNLQRLYTHVERSLIRVDADEVTYPAHVLLRYELERALIDGSLEVADLPGAWDEGMMRLLGISTKGNDRDGCLQDVHWPSGAFGYFPLYTLGALAGAQLFAALQEQHPGVGAEIAGGQFGAINEWLSRSVWSRASSVSTAEILKDATGHQLSAEPFIAHLSRRYLPDGGGTAQ